MILTKNWKKQYHAGTDKDLATYQPNYPQRGPDWLRWLAVRSYADPRIWKKNSMALLFTLIFISSPLIIECLHFSSIKNCLQLVCYPLTVQNLQNNLGLINHDYWSMIFFLKIWLEIFLLVEVTEVFWVWSDIPIMTALLEYFG